MKIISFIFSALFVTLFFSSCSSDNSRYIQDDGAKITKLQISPAEFTMPKGVTTLYTATAYLSDGTTEDVTDKVVWRSADNTIVDINVGGEQAGYALAKNEGNTTIVATIASTNEVDTITSNIVNVTVSSAVLQSINLSPALTKVPLGVKVRYRAVGIYSDDSAYDLTRFCSYEFTDSSVAQESAIASLDFIVDTIGVGRTKITASFEGIESNNASLIVRAADISSLQVTPSLLSIAKGLQQQFSAIAFYTDGTGYDVTKDATWSSDNSSKFIMNSSGVGTAKNLGTLNVTASYLGTNSNAAKVTVTSAVVTSIHLVPAYSVTLPKGRKKQYKVWAYLSDSTSKDVTASAVISIDDLNVATVSSGGSSAGLVHAVGVGSTLVRAEYKSLVDTAPLTVTDAELTSISVTPDDINVSVGKFGNYIAIGTYSDATTTDITKEATWTSSDQSVVHINAFGDDGGFAEALVAGSAVINAHLGSKTSNDANVTVIGKTLNNIQITPNNKSYMVGDTQQYNVHAIYDDLSVKDITAFTYIQSSKPDKASFDSSNLMHAISATDVVRLSTVYEGMSSEREYLHVNEPPVTYSIEVIPNQAKVVLNASGQLRAIKCESDGTETDVTTLVTWSSNNSPLVDVNASGFADSNGTAGTAIITADLNGVSGESNITVENRTIKNIQIAPSNISVLVDSNTTYKVFAIYDNYTQEDVTAFSTLQSLKSGVADFVTHNVLHAKSVGSAELKATYQGFVSEREFVHVNE